MQRGWPNSDEDREYPSRGRRKYERTGAVEGEGGGGRELARAKPTRASLTLTFARARARARVRVYANAPHGATRRPTEWSATKKKKSGKDEPSREPEGKDVRAKRRSEKPRRRNRGVRTSDSNYLELQANDPTIHRHAAPPTTVTFVPRRL